MIAPWAIAGIACREAIAFERDGRDVRSQKNPGKMFLKPSEVGILKGNC
jgi:hypothetical protein